MDVKQRVGGRPPDDRLVRVWQAADTPGEAARRLGVSVSLLRQRVAKLRGAGVALKRFRGEAKVDVEALNRVIGDMK